MKVSVPLGLFWLWLFYPQGEAFKRISIESSNYPNLVDCVNQVITEVLAKEVPTTNILTSSAARGFAVMDFKNELLMKIFRTQQVAFRHDLSSQVTMVKSRRKRTCVLIIETFDDFIKIYLTINRKMYQLNGYYAVVLVSGEFSEVEDIFKLFWKIQIYRAIIIFEDKNATVLVKTFFPFNSTNCHGTTPVIVNRFLDGKFLYSLDKIYSDFKMKNLKKCPIRVAVANDIEPYIFAKVLHNKSYHLTGPSINLITVLSQILNFGINYTYIGPEGLLFDNGTSEGPLKAVLEGDADLTISNWWLKENRLKFFDTTNAYNSDPLHFVIPPGRSYTAFEKLIIPFSPSLWFLTLMNALVGCIVILFVMNRSEKLRNFVFGVGVNYPFLNMFIGYIGETQKFLPKRNFARFLLMMLLLYSLVLRTLYQGSYYQFLKSNRQHKKIETIEEMIANDFKFYIHNGAVDMFSGSEAIRNRFVSL